MSGEYKEGQAVCYLERGDYGFTISKALYFDNVYTDHNEKFIADTMIVNNDGDMRQVNSDYVFLDYNTANQVRRLLNSLIDRGHLIKGE